ncbi:unnamed protein product [Cercospora beticola]|nr:unnamed protein product [Cercospora beticola]
MPSQGAFILLFAFLTQLGSATVYCNAPPGTYISCESKNVDLDWCGPVCGRSCAGKHTKVACEAEYFNGDCFNDPDYGPHCHGAEWTGKNCYCYN